MTWYSSRDTARLVAEPGNGSGRGAFERDRARVLHSFALRRLAAKTQVVEVGESDFPRTRLTHSLECAQIGRELGKVFGCDPDLVETACLAHDLGHPPFGHTGESALDGIAEPCGGFEGNAQSLRILTRLEAKRFTLAGGSAGLNLTRAALDAAMKYPWPRGSGEPKYGVYRDDLPVFEWVRAGAPGGRACFEAQVMDFSDDVAYSVHDLEDTLHAGHVRQAQLRDGAERREVSQLTAKWYVDASTDELEDVFAELLDEPFWPAEYDGTLPALAALKNLTSELIGRFCRSTQNVTRQAYGSDRPLTRYAADLVVPRRTLLECALLKGVTAHYLMTTEDHFALQARQRDLLAELVTVVANAAPRTLEPAFRPAFEAAEDDPARLRVVVDQVASLTDTSAVAWHRRLTQ